MVFGGDRDDLKGTPGKHHPGLAAFLPPSNAPKVHPTALSPGDVALQTSRHRREQRDG